jgi:transcriptional regulator with XRE-family HTH domain
MHTHPLRTVREQAGLTQRALAHKAGVSQTTIALVKSDKHIVHGVSLLRVARALGVTPSEIAGPNQREECLAY